MEEVLTPSPATAPTPTASPRRSRHVGRWAAAGAVALMGAASLALAWAEWHGWPMLAQPAQAWLGRTVGRPVTLEGLQLKLWGGVRLHLDRAAIANPTWSARPHFVEAQQADLHLRYGDLLNAVRGGPVAVQFLGAATLEVHAERRPDGQASWQFGATGDQDSSPLLNRLQLRQWRLDAATVSVNDAPLALSLDGTITPGPSPAETVVGSTGPLALVAQAKGRYRGLPVTFSASSSDALPWLTTAIAPPIPVEVRLHVGQAHGWFKGEVRDLTGRQGLNGQFELSGPSLAAVGAPLRLTLPTTPAFAMKGTVMRDGSRWTAAVSRARIGRSALAGDFSFDTPAGSVPKLSGSLRGSVLWLQDLGPAIGGAVAGEPPPKNQRTLPSRPFDLASLAAMDADVAVALDRLELGHPRLQSVQPLAATVQLTGGVLRIDALDAQLAQGRIRGEVGLDGRAPLASWTTRLVVTGVKLDQWISQDRESGQPPWVAGRVAARIEVQGRGRSTAELLASAQGEARMVLTRGQVSHVAVEAAGLDIAQALGVSLRGDDALPVQCAVADLGISKGVVQVRTAVVDTRDSTLWLEGSVSLADERLALVARVAPKDFSPLALRTPVRVGGTLGQPSITLDKGPILQRLIPAALLVAVNPVLGLLPLMDLGDDDGRDAQTACAGLSRKR